MRFARLMPLTALGLLSACSAGVSPAQEPPPGQPSMAAVAAAVEVAPAAECPDQAPVDRVPLPRAEDPGTSDFLPSSTSALLFCIYDRSVTGPAGSTTTSFTFRSGVVIPQGIVESTVRLINDLPTPQASDVPIWCSMAGVPSFTLIASSAGGSQQQLEVDAACDLIINPKGQIKRGVGQVLAAYLY